MTRCFVIGPIGDRLAPLGTPGRKKYEEALEVYDQIISAACAQVGLSPVRADHIASSGEITEQVFRHLFEDEVVIADVSDGNPNVMYELGLRHTRDLLTLQIGEYGQLPFDVSAIRTIQFSRSEQGLIDARNRLTAALQFGLAEGGDPVTSTRVWLHAASPNLGNAILDTENTGLEIDVNEVEEPEGFLEALNSVEQAFPEMTLHLENVTEIFNEMASLTESSFRDMGALDDDAGASTRLTLIKNFSAGLDELASRMEAESTSYSEKMDSIDGSVNGILEYLGHHYDEFNPDTDRFLVTLTELAESAREGMEGFGELDAGLRLMGDISRLLRAPSKRIGVAVGRLVSKTRLMDEWAGIALRLRRRVTETEN